MDSIIVNREEVGGVTLPVPAEKIKDVRAEIRNVEIDVIRDKVIIQGIVHKQIFFVDFDGIVRHFSEDVIFSTFIDIPGALPEMETQVEIVIEHIKTELSPDGTQITQKIILQIFAKVVDEVQFNVALNPAGPLVKAEEVIGENIKQELIINKTSFPEVAIKVDDIIAEVRVTGTEVIHDKVIVQGIIHKQVFFVDVDNVERHLSEDIPFSTFLDIPGAVFGDNVQVNAQIELIKWDLEQIQGGSILNQEIVFEIFAKVHRIVQANVEVGSGPLIKLPFIIGENTKQDLIISDLPLNFPAIKVKEVNVSFGNLRTVAIKDKVVLQGILHKQIFYVDENNIERYQAEDVPFRNFVNIPGAKPGNDIDFNPVIEDVIFKLQEGNILHQKVIVQYFVKVTEVQQVNVVPGNGPLLKVKEVIGENTKQLLIERRVPEIILPITVEREVATVKEQMVQEILTNSFYLPFKAIKIKSIEPIIQNVKIDVLDDRILVTGEVLKQVTFVDIQNIVRGTTEVVPFEFLIDVPGITPDTNVDDLKIEIENLSFKLVDNQRVDQTIIFKFILGTAMAEQT
ncbi:hypothetical protein BBF96_14665 [Anoxybacter fermentans]|uniref:SipL SPOCS domain-containing protein n=1 Tax=Anoxybacter fermentans TaxID=1323375 RepID=A0A3Q9HSF2_9FIRM|nr:DUF3794 domain-containing protein [Anoxybacter fermentans]AZR74518.1 hypothetical protein BBF96_14665 [Anoxybacter fermentans]